MYTLSELQKAVANYMDHLDVDGNPHSLYEPIAYSISAGGKRLRPMLTVLACNIFSDNALQALPAAAALEVFHTFTLLHDDIMDNAPTRRGNYLDEDGNILYGQQSVSGGNLKHVLVKNTSAENVQFVITRISATEYHAYTYKVADLNSTSIGSFLEVYKTILVYGEHEDGETNWHLHGSMQGYAQAFAPRVVSKSVDITTFTTIKPTSITN